ncbi:hypothetical protein [Roseicitreum antarcticum]|uniref:Argininosuccinate lyase n=1 Tax=Roseicitreum antarcticum TaxID=564137 RepID=A0A1H2VZ78_9RHOB|nr:hypothetical protein [Roseicitreum antarcticum]SDW73623.1 hypothetical protein SAMN04488238_103219 [Roseicitreum antarcticum]
MTLLRNAFFAIAVLVTASAATAQDVAYELTNVSGYTVVQVFTSPANSGDWGDDILGANVLETGYTSTVYIMDNSDQCEYDILFVFDDGDEMSDQIDICDLASYTIE